LSTVPTLHYAQLFHLRYYTHEHTTQFIAIKPDGVQRNKMGEIIGRFEAKGFKLVAMKLVWPNKEKAAGHYDDLKAKKFFGGLCDFFSSGPVCAMVWEGLDAIKSGRVMLGATNPADSLPGSIRGDLCIDIGRNICHGSDCPEAAEKEIAFWFSKSEICDWDSAQAAWVYEQGQSLDHAEGSGSGVDAVDTANPTEFPPHGAYGKNQERTFIAIKPDGVQRNLIGNIIGRFEAKGFKLAAMRLIWPSPEKAAGHYDDLKAKKFFPGLVSYFSSGPVVSILFVYPINTPPWFCALLRCLARFVTLPHCSRALL
jgi:nucleoside-diphosphate kinase